VRNKIIYGTYKIKNNYFIVLFFHKLHNDSSGLYSFPFYGYAGTYKDEAEKMHYKTMNAEWISHFKIFNHEYLLGEIL
jgi:hypothetical protein